MSTTSVARLQEKQLKGVTYEVMNVSPDIAQKFLSANRRNRRIYPNKVAQYARAMAAGEFDFNGESVQIAADGTLLNGQHRFRAIIESGCTIPILIVRGLPLKAQDTMDVNIKRSGADVLEIYGETNAKALSSITRRALMWDLGFKTNAGGRFVPSEREIFRYLEGNPSIRGAVDVAVKGKRMAQMPQSVLGLCFYVCSRVDHMAAKEFFVDQVVNAIGLGYGDPARALRSILATQTTRPGRIAETDVLGYTLRAWNLYRTGQRAQKLQAPKGGWNNTNIPDPI